MAKYENYNEIFPLSKRKAGIITPLDVFWNKYKLQGKDIWQESETFTENIFSNPLLPPDLFMEDYRFQKQFSIMKDHARNGQTSMITGFLRNISPEQNKSYSEEYGKQQVDYSLGIGWKPVFVEIIELGKEIETQLLGEWLPHIEALDGELIEWFWSMIKAKKISIEGGHAENTANFLANNCNTPLKVLEELISKEGVGYEEFRNKLLRNNKFITVEWILKMKIGDIQKDWDYLAMNAYLPEEEVEKAIKQKWFQPESLDEYAGGIRYLCQNRQLTWEWWSKQKKALEVMKKYTQTGEYTEHSPDDVVTWWASSPAWEIQDLRDMADYMQGGQFLPEARQPEGFEEKIASVIYSGSRWAKDDVINSLLSNRNWVKESKTFEAACLPLIQGIEIMDYDEDMIDYSPSYGRWLFANPVFTEDLLNKVISMTNPYLILHSYTLLASPNLTIPIIERLYDEERLGATFSRRTSKPTPSGSRVIINYILAAPFLFTPKKHLLGIFNWWGSVLR